MMSVQIFRLRNVVIFTLLAMLALGIYIVLQIDRERAERERAQVVTAALRGSQAEVNRFFESNGKLPDNFGAFLRVRSIDQAAGRLGQVRATVSVDGQRFQARFADDQGSYANKALFVMPKVVAGRVEWSCSAPDVRGGALPATCR